MSSIEVIGPRAGAAPLTLTLTELGTVDLQSVFAHFDGSGAGGSFLPALTVRAQDGSILARVFPDTSLGAGDTADVTFAPFLRAAGGGSSGGGTLDLVVFNLPGLRIVQTGVARIYAPQAGTITALEANLGAAATGSDFTCRVNKNGASIGTVTIPATTFVASAAPSSAAVAAGDYFTVDVTAVGSTLAGSDLVVQLVGTWS